MTEKEFLEQLALTSKHFKSDWTIIPMKGMRLFVPGGCFCPLTAVAEMNEDQFYKINEWSSAGERLNLSEDFRVKVVDAADMVGNPTHDVADVDALRKKLFEAIGIEYVNRNFS